VVSARRLRVRWISWYLSGAKDAPDFLAQVRQVLWILSRVRQFFSADGLQTTRFVSSTKPILVWGRFAGFVCSRSGEMKIRKRIGERGEP